MLKKVSLLAAVALLLSLCVAPRLAYPAGLEGSLQIDGSTTVGPIAVAFAGEFMANNPDLSITVKQTGSGDGAAALVDSRCDIADMSRFMKPDEFKKAVANGVYPVAHVVAMDGVCVIVHPSNSIGALTSTQVRDIYKGVYRNWKELGGPDMPIAPITRDSSSGTFETFEGLVMNKQKMAAHVETVGSNAQALQRCKSTVGAIAYVGLGYVTAEVKALEIDGVKPTRKTIASGVYPISRPLFMFTNGYPKLGSPAHAFVTFYLTEKGQEIIEDKGFVPLTNY